MKKLREVLDNKLFYFLYILLYNYTRSIITNFIIYKYSFIQKILIYISSIN